MSDTFICGTCGEVHDRLAMDLGFTLPDDVWAIPEEQRKEKAKFDSNLCCYDGRFFIRCVLSIPFKDGDEYFGYGIWVEVERSVFERYLALWEVDGSAEPQYPARVANALPLYGDVIGASAFIQFGPIGKRPMVYLLRDDQSPLAREQRNGIDEHRHHEILAAR